MTFCRHVSKLSYIVSHPTNLKALRGIWRWPQRNRTVKRWNAQKEKMETMECTVYNATVLKGSLLFLDICNSEKMSNAHLVVFLVAFGMHFLQVCFSCIFSSFIFGDLSCCFGGSPRACKTLNWSFLCLPANMNEILIHRCIIFNRSLGELGIFYI